jgi:uncharacterized protein YheU (UPF0270 family)
MNASAGVVVVPHAQLPAQTLRALIEAFVLREGTDYGAREFTLEEKVAHVLAQLERGAAQVIFETESQSVDIVLLPPAPRAQRP